MGSNVTPSPLSPYGVETTGDAVARPALVQDQFARRLGGIEASRGIAASAVILYHVARYLDGIFGAPILRTLFQFGHAGVDFFFVISGFIILFVHFDDVGNPARLRRYVGRRFTRLMPTYWVALLLTIALDLVKHHPTPSPARLFWSATLLPSGESLIVDVAWTLQFELVFYAFFCVLIAHRRLGLGLLAVWFSATVLAALGLLRIGWLPGVLLGAYNLEFFLGMAAAYLLKTRTLPNPWLILGPGLGLMALAAVLEDANILDGYGDPARLAYGIPAMLIVLGIAAADRDRRLHVSRAVRAIGSASYSIYLFQFLFISVAWNILVAMHLSHRLPLLATFVILVLAAVLGGVLISQRVEYPLMRFLRRRYSRIALSDAPS
jgi:peptidoglycan/LPS O-acetylase OafA/YrhL